MTSSSFCIIHRVVRELLVLGLVCQPPFVCASVWDSMYSPGFSSRDEFHPPDAPNRSLDHALEWAQKHDGWKPSGSVHVAGKPGHSLLPRLGRPLLSWCEAWQVPSYESYRRLSKFVSLKMPEFKKGPAKYLLTFEQLRCSPPQMQLPQAPS